jgi:polyphosphate kinase 2 (PPK2 family)
MRKCRVLGEVMIFNRSHYEDVLVPTVNGWITPGANPPALCTDQRL